MSDHLITEVFVSSIPSVLISKNNWCCWSPAPRANGGTAKAPRTPLTLEYARPDKSSTWGTFSEAVDKLSASVGLGFVVDVRDRLVCVDLDHCIQDDGTATAEAQEIADNLNSYTEYSPSGSGLHIWCFADLTRNYDKAGQIEIYADRHFMTVTGNVYGHEAPICDRSSVLGGLIDYYFPTQKPQERDTRTVTPLPVNSDDVAIRKLCADPRRARLWEGDTAVYNGDASACDLALCNHIIYWTGSQDPTVIDRVFRRSGLMRAKWDERHSADGSTYGSMTIRKALSVRR